MAAASDHSRKSSTGHLTALGLGLLALLLASLPYVRAWSLQTEESRFTGLVGGVDDNSVYIELIRQARDGSVLLSNNFTAEPARPSMFNVLYLTLGLLARFTGLPLIAVHHLFGVCSTLLFALAAHRFFGGAFRDGRFQAAGVALALFASGTLGYMAVISMLFGRSFKTVDSWLVELSTFHSVLIYPHFVFAAALIMLSLHGLLLSLTGRRLAFALLGGLVSVLIVFSHAFEVATVLGTIGMLTVVLFVRDGLRDARWRAACLATFTLPVGIALVGTRLMLRREPAWDEVVWRLDFLAPDPLQLLLGTGLTAATALLFFARGVDRPRGGENDASATWVLAGRCWIVALLVILYLPWIPGNWHLVNGVQIPLALVALDGLRRHALVGRTTFGWLRRALRRGPAWVRPAWLTPALLFVFCFFASLSDLAFVRLYLLAPERSPTQLYLARSDLETLRWLEENAGPREVVVAAPETAHFIPLFSGKRVFAGEDLLASHYKTKVERVHRFFGSGTDDERASFLREFSVGYVMYGRVEQDLGDWDPSSLGCLELAFASMGSSVYRVRPNGC